MDEQKFRTILAALAREEIGDEMDRWPEIQAKVAAMAQPPRIRRVRRGGQLLLVAVLMLLVSAAAYGFSQTTQTRGIEGAKEANRTTQLGVSQTIDNVQVTLNWAYADGNLVALEFRTLLFNADGEPLRPRADTPFTARLLDANGQVLSGYPSRAGSSILPRPVELEFQIASLTTDQLDLTFELVFNERPRMRTLPEMWFGPAQRVSSAAIMGGGVPQPESTAEPVPSLPVPETGVGPFRFQFTLPIEGAITLEPMQTINTGFTEVTLTYLSHSATQTTVRLCYKLPEEMAQQGWTPEVVLVIGDLVADSGSTAYRYREQTCTRMIFDVFVGERPESLIVRVKAFGVSMGNDTWLQALQAINDDSIIKVEQTGEFSYRYSRSPNDKVVLRALAEAGYRIEGPWDFEVKLPSGTP